jgi:hypothetical protein
MMDMRELRMAGQMAWYALRCKRRAMESQDREFANDEQWIPQYIPLHRHSRTNLNI